MHGDERVSGRREHPGVCSRGAGEVLTECVDAEDAERADEYQARLHDPCGDEPESSTVAVVLGDGVQGDGGSHAREGGEYLEDSTHWHSAGTAGAGDEAGVLQDIGPEPELDGDREQEGADVGETGDQRRSPQRCHRTARRGRSRRGWSRSGRSRGGRRLRNAGVGGDGHVSSPSW